jgi:hypothetical protein
MEIYFINICTEWYFNLYNEYIFNIILFIKNKFNFYVNQIFIDENNDYITKFKEFYNKKYKYIFTGNIEKINTIYDKYRNKNFYYLNVEQMSMNSYFENIKQLDKYFNIIDYCEENIPFLQSYFKNVYLIPPYYNDLNLDLNLNINFNNQNQIKNINNKDINNKDINNKDINNKDINIISLANNIYRRNILNKINSKFNIYLIDNIFGETRDNLFKRTKIYINIHSSENHKTMELIRIINLLKKKVIVLSQNTIFPDLLKVSKSIIIFHNIEQLEYLLNDILNNYNSYYDYIFNQNFVNYDNYVYENIKKILI